MRSDWGWCDLRATWQRARVAPVGYLPGFDCWVEVGPPEKREGLFAVRVDGVPSDIPGRDSPTYLSNIISPSGGRVAVAPEYVELLPEFRRDDEIEFESYPAVALRERLEG